MPLPSSLFPYFWHFIRPYKGVFAAYILCALAAGLWGPFNSLLLKHIINILPEAHHLGFHGLWGPASLIALNFIVFDNFTWRGLDWIRCHYTPVIMNTMIAQTKDYILGHSHQFFLDHLSGQITKHITNLADGFQRLAHNVTSNFLRGSSLLVAALVASYSVHPYFFVVILLWAVLFVGSSLFMSRRLVVLSNAQNQAESRVVGEIVDAIANSMLVRLFARKAYEHTRLSPILKEQEQTYRNTWVYILIMHSVQGALIACMMAFSAYFLVHLYVQKLVTIGDFALILGLCMETGHVMWFTVSEVDELNIILGRGKQSLSALLPPHHVQDKAHAATLVCHKGDIVWQNVTFQFHNTTPLFTNLSLTVPAGQKVGLVGYSGSGKTTFVNVMLRLYDVTDGAIFIDGLDIRDVTQDSLRTSMAIIPQDPTLFHRSLMDNIRYGRIDATDEEVIEAAKKAHAHEFIATLPQGYNSLVGERGIKLSGGQRQRIAFARAILKNAPILILDEATSQLDSVTESLIQESLWELMHGHDKASGEVGKTTIVIAHRLSTLLGMDRILVFDKGNIVEDGKHTELLEKGGLYTKLWDAQVGGFLGDGSP